MTKRIISLVLVCILAIPILVVPASATTTDNVTSTQFDQFVLGLGNLLNSIEANLLDVLENIEIYCNYIYNYLNDWIYTKLAAIETAVNNAGEAVTQSLTRLTSTLNYHFENLQTWFDELIEAISGTEEDQTNADQVGEEIATQESQFNDAQEILQEATRPDIEDVNVEISGTQWKNGNYNQALTWLFIHPRTNTPTPLFYILFYSMTLALVSYGIFGKR